MSVTPEAAYMDRGLQVHRISMSDYASVQRVGLVFGIEPVFVTEPLVAEPNPDGDTTAPGGHVLSLAKVTVPAVTRWIESGHLKLEGGEVVVWFAKTRSPRDH